MERDVLDVPFSLHSFLHKYEIAKTLTTDNAKLHAIESMNPRRGYAGLLAKTIISDEMKLQLMDLIESPERIF